MDGGLQRCLPPLCAALDEELVGQGLPDPVHNVPTQESWGAAGCATCSGLTIFGVPTLSDVPMQMAWGCGHSAARPFFTPESLALEVCEELV